MSFKRMKYFESANDHENFNKHIKFVGVVCFSRERFRLKQKSPRPAEKKKKNETVLTVQLLVGGGGSLKIIPSSMLPSGQPESSIGGKNEQNFHIALTPDTQRIFKN